jgi:hypothetical protein
VSTTTAQQIVPYQHEHKDGVIDLWAAVFDADVDEKRRYFEWKYEQNPYISAPILFIALDGERVVGTRGFHGSQWKTREGSVVIPCAEDFAIAPEHRNGSLATSIMHAALDDLEQRGYEFVMNASGGQATVLHSLAMGWKSIGAMAPVARRADRGRARLAVDRLARKARSYWRPGRLLRARYRDVVYGKPFDRLDRVSGLRAPGNDTTIVVERSPDPRMLAGVAARLHDDGRIRHVRDAGFFRWRFGHPDREYRILLSECDGEFDGYMVIARGAQSFPFQISAWEGISQGVREGLLAFALSEGGFVALGTWTASLPEADRDLLERSGFRPTELELRRRGMPCVLLRKLGAAGGDWSMAGVPALDPSNWDIRLIDSMHG